ncbi:MAG: 50S ribosomal protein L10 [Desulfobacteraceae bacterium]
MDKNEKIAFVNDVKGRLERAKATYLVDYKGLDVTAMNRLRRELKDAGSEFQVVKNRLLALASRDTETAVLKDYFVGPSAIAITYDDMVAPAKVLVNLGKEYKDLEIKAGQISGKVMDFEAVERVAKLPTRDELLAQVLAAMQAVPGSFVRVLNGVLMQFMNVLAALQEKKQAEA